MEKFEGQIVDIINKTIFNGVVKVHEGKIASIDSWPGAGKDLPFILPGFIDSHIHIESSMLTPVEFSRAVVNYGIIGVVTDPHEIANVLGKDGVKFMIDNASRTSFNFCFGAPSCVPSCSADIETSGAMLTSQEVGEILDNPAVGYLSEVMNYPGVLLRNNQVMAKIEAAKRLGKQIDGHAPGLMGEERRKYASAGISTDHECSSYEEGLSCIENDMFVQIREGSAARNFEALIPLIAKYPEKIMFCSDDIHPTSSKEAPIISHVRRAIAYGYDKWDVLRAASLNPQVHYGLDWGLLRPGDPATFIIADSISEKMNILETYLSGEPLKIDESPVDSYPNRFMVSDISDKDIASTFQNITPIIVAQDGELITTSEYASSDDENYPWEEVQKIVVVNRYDSIASPSVGHVRGFNIKNGAMAASIAHDCHNIVAIGSSDENIVRAVNEVIRMKGGITVIDKDNNVVCLELPIAGLLTPLGWEQVARKNAEIMEAIASTGCQMRSPLITMSFMCLPVIPELKITDKGIFDASKWSFIR